MLQSQALSILKTGTNVFLTGEPGSGKTHTVNAYAAYLRARGVEPAVTASTGIAATHLGGVTLHSWSGIGIKTKLEKADLDRITSNEYVAKRIRRTSVLIVDEVSMLPPAALSMVEVVCRTVRVSAEPFGGIQIVLVGDFFQLPPVVKTEEEDAQRAMLAEDAPGRFAYNSSAWPEAGLNVCYLTEQHRQDDGDFLALLSAIRNGTFDDRHLRLIRNRRVAPHAAPPDAPKLFSHNMDVDRINNMRLATLSGESRSFAMSSQGPEALVRALKKGCLSPETLHLKAGAAVMFTKNNPKEGFVNGTLGTVVGFREQTEHPVVETRSGRTIEAAPMDWTVEEHGTIRAQITQIPLRLAWAITVHKSQGMSMDEAVMDLSHVFEFGQGYVALSRVRRLAGVHILGWNARAWRVHPDAAGKDEEFRALSEKTAREAGGVSEEEMAARHERFVRACGGRSVAESGPRAPREHASLQGARRRERTLALVREGKTAAEIARMCGRTEGTILKHLETLRAQGSLSARDVAHLARGAEEAVARIHAAFATHGAEQLSPAFHGLGGAYSYEQLRIARLLFDEKSPSSPPSPSRLEQIRTRHARAYLPWDQRQDEDLRKFFVEGASVADLARTLDRTRGAVRARLAKLGLVDKA